MFITHSAEVESTYQLTSGATPNQVQVKSKPVVFTLDRVISAGPKGVDNSRQPLNIKVDELDNCQVSQADFPSTRAHVCANVCACVRVPARLSTAVYPTICQSLV